MNNIGNIIKKARKSLGFSQADLAKELSISVVTLSRWEQGHTNIPYDKLMLMADLLQLSPQQIVSINKPDAKTEGTATPHYNYDAINSAMHINDNVAFQGVEGAHSHLACQEALPNFTPKACHSFDDVFEAIEQNEAGLALIPIENNLGGRVADIHRILPDSNLFMIGEHFHDVHHNLLVLPGTQLADLRTVHSHEQALAQCHHQIKKLQLGIVKTTDTAGAAQDLAKSGDRSVGVIASKLAAKIYNLQILRERMEDRVNNVTRFIILTRRRYDADPDLPCITSFIFTMRSIPAALYKCLGGFATNGINFLRLESYIRFGDRSHVQFYAEIEGHPNSHAVSNAMLELGHYTHHIKILGVFPAHPARERHYN